MVLIMTLRFIELGSPIIASGELCVSSPYGFDFLWWKPTPRGGWPSSEAPVPHDGQVGTAQLQWPRPNKAVGCFIMSPEGALDIML